MAKKTEINTKTTAADIRALTDDQIAKRVTDLAKEKMNLRFQKAGGQLENPKSAMVLRKEVARLKTEQTARRSTKSV